MLTHARVCVCLCVRMRVCVPVRGMHTHMQAVSTGEPLGLGMDLQAEFAGGRQHQANGAVAILQLGLVHDMHQHGQQKGCFPHTHRESQRQTYAHREIHRRSKGQRIRSPMCHDKQSSVRLQDACLSLAGLPPSPTLRLHVSLRVCGVCACVEGRIRTGCLAGPRLGDADDVSAGKGDRHRLRLDGGRGRVPERSYDTQQRLVQSPLRELYGRPRHVCAKHTHIEGAAQCGDRLRGQRRNVGVLGVQILLNGQVRHGRMVDRRQGLYVAPRAWPAVRSLGSISRPRRRIHLPRCLLSERACPTGASMWACIPLPSIATHTHAHAHTHTHTRTDTHRHTFPLAHSHLRLGVGTCTSSSELAPPPSSSAVVAALPNWWPRASIMAT
jgi:hypothetical protein